MIVPGDGREVRLRRIRPTVLAVALMGVTWCGGCRGEPPPELPAGDDDDDAAAVDGAFALFHVHDNGDRTAVHGVFARDLPETGVIDGLAALGVADPGLGYWAPPEITDEMVPVHQLEVGWLWPADRFYDAGDPLVVAGVQAARLDAWSDADGIVSDDVVTYAGEGPSGVLDDLAAGGSWPGGVDLAAGAFPDPIQPLSAPALTSHEPGSTVRWVEGTDLTLEWSEAPRGEVLVTLLGDQAWAQARVPEGGEFTVPADVLAGAVLDTAEVRVSRTELVEYDVAPGRVRVRQTREQRLNLEYSGVLVADPPDLYLGETTSLAVTHLDGVFVDGDTSFDLGVGITVQSVVIPGGTGPEAQLEVVVAVDALTGPRDLQAVIAGEPVVSERALRVLLPRAESCATAFTLPDEGSFHGDLSGMADDLSDPSACTGYPATGPDAVFRVIVPEYAIIAVTLWIPGADAVVYLFHDCDDAADPVVCSDSGGLNVPEEMSHSPLPGHAGAYHLAVDVFEGLPEGTGEYTLDVELIGY
jgi:hypothetical protein